MASTYPPENLVEDGIVFVIDMIKDFLDPGEEFVIDEGREMYAKTRELLEFAREHGMPIVYAASQHMQNTGLDRWWQIRDGVSCVAGSPTVDVADELHPGEYSDYEVYLPKIKYSAFYGSRLDTILANPPFKGRNTIIVTGMATNFCCMTTTIDAFNRDYDVVFVDDLNCTFDGVDGTPAEVMHRVTVETIKQGFAAEIVMADQLLTRLAEKVPVPVSA